MLKWSNPFTPAVVGSIVIMILTMGVDMSPLPIHVLPLAPLVGAFATIAFFELFTECDPA